MIRKNISLWRVPVSVFVLMALFAVGIFFRTSHFHDWLRFNADQSRDATLVSDVITGQEPLPLLGPKAGGTDFRLGPAFYYFQIGAAKLFGNTPDVLAYPELFLSLLTLPLLFIFLRKYFDVRMALLLVALLAVSAYAVKYGRFAWNPNALPFWTLLFLYALFEMIRERSTLRVRWPILAGVALGMGVQLHTLTLILWPIVTVVVLAFLLWKKKNIWRAAALLFVCALLLNTGQLVSEFQTGGANTAAFLNGVGTKEEKGDGVIMNVLKDVTCFVDGTTYILSSYDASDSCDWKFSTITQVVMFGGGSIFFFGGVILGVRALRRESDSDKKYFIALSFLYGGLYFALLIPLANEISMRFFLASLFLPFVFLGLWWQYLEEKSPRFGFRIGGLLVFALMVANILSVRQTFMEYAAYLDTSDAGMDNVLLQEVERFADFVVTHTDTGKTVWVHGDATFLFKALKSMQYFTERSGISLTQKQKNASDPEGSVFLIDNTKRTEKILRSYPTISDYESFGRFTIFKEQ